MCGRYTLKAAPEVIAEQFQVEQSLEVGSPFNIAPSQSVACIRVSRDSLKREVVLLRWGLIPSWATDPKIGMNLINARSETVSQKPAFREAFRYRRCLVPADGFYEWKRVGRTKQPYYIRLHDDQPFAFAGLWESWVGPDGEVVQTCVVLTIEPNELMKDIHNRMPVILDPKHYDLWLDPTVQAPERLLPLLCSYPARDMVADPVNLRGTHLNPDDSMFLDIVKPEE